MKSTDQQHFTLLLTSVAELYNKKLSKPLLDIYWHCLEPYSLALIRRALNMHLLHPDCGQFMPKPADILRIIHGDGETQALRAWNKVLRAVRKAGSYGAVVFDDPIIHVAIIELGGWVELCRCDTKALPFIGKQFEKIYSNYLQQNPLHYPRQLAGQSKSQSTQSSGQLDPLCLFGNKAKALEVWQHGCELNDYMRQFTGVHVDSAQLQALTCDAKNNLKHADLEIQHNSIFSGDKHREK